MLRRDNKSLSIVERKKLLEPYLPTPPSHSPEASPDRRTGRGRPRSRSSRFGVRQFLRTQFYILVYGLIHAIFSIYIRFRHAYHAVVDRVYSIFYYHHRTPALIERDVKVLKRLPKHLSVILKLEDNGRGAELERLVDEVADIAAWCACAGIPTLSVYEKTGALKAYLPETHRIISEKLAAYFGRRHPALTVQAPHLQSVESSASPCPSDSDGAGVRQINVLLLSVEDGRDSIVDLTKTMAEMAQRSKLSPADISIDLVDAELTEGVMGEPDLLIHFGPYLELSGYPPWQIRLTEIFHVQDNQGVGYQVFYSGLCKYARAQMRFGR